jgi:anti-anti-sigma factor
VTSHPCGATAAAGAEQAIPVVVAALGPQALRISGESADGTLPFLAGPKALEQHIIPVLTRPAAGAGRPAPRVIVTVPAVGTGGARAPTARAAVWYNSGVATLTTSVTVHDSGQVRYTLVELAGEADVTTSDTLHALLEAEGRKNPSLLIIDLSRLSFMDSATLQAILRAHRMLGNDGGVLALVSPHNSVARILEMTEADRIVPVYASVQEAVDR